MPGCPWRLEFSKGNRKNNLNSLITHQDNQRINEIDRDKQEF